MRIYTITWPFMGDCYILKMPDQSELPPHKDPMRGKWKKLKHYRLNIVIKKPKSGGEFTTEEGGVIFNLFNRVILIRPDIYEHQVSKVQGSRYVLSFGFAI